MSAAKTTLRERIANGAVLTALRGSITTPRERLADIWSSGRYDYLWIDTQHTPCDDQQLIDYCAAAADLDIDVQVRLPHTRLACLAGRYLDFGATAILAPEVEEVDTVDELIDNAYYQPIGRRSWGGLARRAFSPDVDRRAYADWWNDTVVVGIQVESVRAVQNVRELVKPGITVVTFGPNDLAFSLDDNPDFPLRTTDECIKEVARQLAGVDVRLALGLATPDEARQKYLDMGITLFQAETPDA